MFYLYDDENVTKTETNHYKSSEVYMLFYELEIQKNELKKDIINHRILTLRQYVTDKGIRIPARSETLVNIELEHDLEYLCKARVLENGLIIGNALLKSKNKKATVNILNNSQVDFYLYEIDLELEPLRNYQVLKLRGNSDNDLRIDKLKATLSTSHLNEEEKYNFSKY